jgi:hypothetical protein
MSLVAVNYSGRTPASEPETQHQPATRGQKCAATRRANKAKREANAVAREAASLRKGIEQTKLLDLMDELAAKWGIDLHPEGDPARRKRVPPRSVLRAQPVVDLADWRRAAR